MPRFYKKGALGRLVEAEDAYDSAIVEVWMSVQEYRDFKREIRDAEAKADNAQRRMRNILQESKTQDEEQIKKLEADAQEKISAEKAIVEQQKKMIAALEDKVKKAEADAANAAGLNQNLLRIMKERANQERGIRPKKQHEGYLVLECRQWTEKYVEDVWSHPDHKYVYDTEEKRPYAKKHGYLTIDHKAANVWKSVIQTPADASIPLENVQSVLQPELNMVLGSLNLKWNLETEFKGKYIDFGKIFPDYSEDNMLYRTRYRANYREGFWEIEIFTTKALVVPEYLRPPARGRKNRKGESA